MVDTISSIEPVKPRIRRFAISYTPGVERFDPNTLEWVLREISQELADSVDRMAEQRGISNGEMLWIIFQHHEMKAAQEWLAHQKQEAASASRETPTRSHAGRRWSETKTMSPPTEGIPFMITKAMKERLEKLGYAPKEIHEMAPAQAHHILGAQQKPEGRR
jgi:hypothetical protein